jgi:MFS superfamily sulfate permease-like transporter
LINKKTFLSDFSASIVVFLVALPLCLGVAVASGAPPFSGIIAGVIGGIVVGYFSGSNISVSGPAAGLTSIVAAAILDLKFFEAFLLAVFLSGVIQIVMGLLKAGVIGDFIPNSVIKGMLAAIGIILMLKQIPHFVGYDTDPEGDEDFFQLDQKNTFSELYSLLNHFEFGAIIIALVGVSILMLWESNSIKNSKVFKLIPGPLLAVVIGIFINELFDLLWPQISLKSEHLVQLPIFTSSKDFFSSLNFPMWSEILNYKIWITAFTIAIVASIETLLSIEAVDKIDPQKNITPANKELIAQGIGNSLSGLIGGIPITSVIVRSSANVNSGGKTKLSTILHGFFLLLSVLFAASLLNLLPKSVLAAILILTGYKLANIQIFKEYYKKGFDQFAPFIITIIAIVFTDLLKGIAIGILVGLFFTVRSNFRTSIFIIKDNNNYLIRFRKEVSFLNKSFVKRRLSKIPNNSAVIIDPTKADFIDKDIVDLVNDFIETSSSKGIRVYIERIKGKPEVFIDIAHKQIKS